MRPLSRLLILTGLFAFCFATGCYEHTSKGEQSVYHFAWWVGPAIICASILGAVGAWFLREWSMKLAIGLMIAAPLAAIFIAPAMFLDKVVVDDHHFEARYGFWFNPTRHDIRFEDLLQIQYVSRTGNRGRKSYEMLCIDQSGQTTVVHAGDLVRSTVPEILDRAKAKGVVVINYVH